MTTFKEHKKSGEDFDVRETLKKASGLRIVRDAAKTFYDGAKTGSLKTAVRQAYEATKTHKDLSVAKQTLMTSTLFVAGGALGVGGYTAADNAGVFATDTTATAQETLQETIADTSTVTAEAVQAPAEITEVTKPHEDVSALYQEASVTEPNSTQAPAPQTSTIEATLATLGLENATAQEIKDEAFRQLNLEGGDQATGIALMQYAADQGNPQAIRDVAYLESINKIASVSTETELQAAPLAEGSPTDALRDNALAGDTQSAHDFAILQLHGSMTDFATGETLEVPKNFDAGVKALDQLAASGFSESRVQLQVLLDRNMITADMLSKETKIELSLAKADTLGVCDTATSKCAFAHDLDPAKQERLQKLFDTQALQTSGVSGLVTFTEDLKNTVPVLAAK